MIKEDWIECTLGEVGNIFSGGTPKTGEPTYWGDDISWISPSDLSNFSEKYISKGKKSISQLGLQKSSAQLFPKNTVLFSSRAPIGYTVIASKEMCTNQGFKSIYPFGEINSEYIFYFLKRSKQEAERVATGTTFKEISKTAFSKLLFPLAPLPIQRAIVAKIEELFSSLDSGIADLKKAQDQLVIYRQAVLKKAFEGELTKEWREKQTDLPSADELLEQIKVERQKHYEQQIEDWKVAVKEWEKLNGNGRRPIKPQSIKKFKEVSSDENLALPDLPTNWCWEKFGNVCLKIMDGTHFSPKNLPAGEYKYITAKNIKEGRIDLTKISFVSKEDHQEIYARCDVKRGDVLYIKDGATTGKAAINCFDEEFSLLSSVGVFRTSHNLISPKFLEYYLNAQITRNRMLSNIAGVAITRLTLVKLSNSIFIICSQAEQLQIISEIESRLSVCDMVEESIKESLEKAESLRQSILKKAFAGELLNTEEIEKCRKEKDYEPAVVLLERIKSLKIN